VTQWLSTISSWFFSEIFTRIGFLLALILMAGLLRQRRSPSSTIAWLLAILLLPNVGVPLYIIFGGRKVRLLIAMPTAPPSGCWHPTACHPPPAATASSSCRRA
jgi:hypothetical protein